MLAPQCPDRNRGIFLIPQKTRKALLRTPSLLVLVTCRSTRSRGGTGGSRSARSRGGTGGSRSARNARTRGGTGNARDARGAGSASHRIFVNFYSCWSEAHSNSFLCCLLPGVVHSRSLLRQLDRIPASCFLFTRKCDRNTSCCVVCFYSYFVSEWVKVIGFPVVVSLNFLCLFAQKCAFGVYEYSTYHNRDLGR